MNTDRNEADAKFVADAMGLKYATLRAEGIPEKYGVQGFPTLILIDPEGTVRDVHVGYSPTLRADLAKDDRGPPATQVTAAAVRSGEATHGRRDLSKNSNPSLDCAPSAR